MGYVAIVCLVVVLWGITTLKIGGAGTQVTDDVLLTIIPASIIGVIAFLIWLAKLAKKKAEKLRAEAKKAEEAKKKAEAKEKEEKEKSKE